MAYTPAYTQADFKAIVVDGLGTAGASTVGWIELIVLLFILGLLAGIFAKLIHVFKK